MLVNLVFDNKANVVDVPESVARDLQIAKRFFGEWAFDIRNNHPFWIPDNEGKRYAVDMSSEVFVYWLNNIVWQPESPRAAIIERSLAAYDRSLPTVYF